MNDFIKWILRTTLIGVAWVFLLSVTVNGRTVFSYANNTLVQNNFVQMLDQELTTLWFKVYNTARITFDQMTNPDRKS
ncbi:MAG: hypothetical protein AB7T49_13850 [Oligoflexales bacterium]